jgi:ABC-type amino acid transport substrate-binding protein
MRATAASSLSAFALEQNPALNFEIVADYEAADRADAGSAIGVAKGNEAFQFNAAYSGMLADGSAAVIFTKWS